MKGSKVQRTLVTFALLTLTLAGLGPTASVSAWQASPNLLQNPGFEGDYYAWSGINEVQVAHGWTPWWRQRTDSDPPTTYYKPEYKRAVAAIFPQRVHGGLAAQQWFTFHATHQAGMYQQVFGVTPGTWYRFAIWAQVWSSTEDNPNVSVNPAYANMQVGIDPTGNWDPWAGTVIWSGTYGVPDTWGYLAVEARAQNNVITVFLRSHPDWPVKHNDTYWDDAELVAIGPGAPPAPPTATPVGPAPPSATPAGPPSPTPTCAPRPADWVTYYVVRGDTLYALATRTGTTVDRVISVNCLSTTLIEIGQALLLPSLPPSVTPSAGTSTATRAAATATAEPTDTATAAPSATRTRTPTVAPSATPTRAVVASPTVAPATPTSAPAATATATPTRARPTIPPPFTSTPGSPAPPPTSTSPSGSSRPCGAIAVGGGFVVLAGAIRFRRRERSD